VLSRCSPALVAIGAVVVTVTGWWAVDDDCNWHDRTSFRSCLSERVEPGDDLAVLTEILVEDHGFFGPSDEGDNEIRYRKNSYWLPYTIQVVALIDDQEKITRMEVR
jgi:hypothetical protein